MDKTSAVYNWSPKLYVDLIENSQFPSVVRYQEAERNYLISKILSANGKTFVDIGAGYGRVLPLLAKTGKRVIAIEIDKQMLGELRNRAKVFKNVEVIEGDASNLCDLLSGKKIESPVLVCLENTLGTWVGDYFKALSQMKKVAEEKKGEVIIAIWRQEAFRRKAVAMYKYIADLVGETDLEKIDYKSGIFWSKTGFRSKWWTKKDREEILSMLGGKKLEGVDDPYFCIFHITYKK